MSQETSVSSDQACIICGEDAHPAGSTQYRNCRATELDFLLDHPEEWRFTPTSLETDIIRKAYTEAVRLLEGRTIPEVSIILKLVGPICQEEKIDPITFWSEFQHDMPEILTERLFMHHHDSVKTSGVPELELLWQSIKVCSMLQMSGLPYLDYDVDFIEILLPKAPMKEDLLELVGTVARLHNAVLEGYSPYDMTIEDRLVTWHYRKPRRIGPSEQRTEEVTKS